MKREVFLCALMLFASPAAAQMRVAVESKSYVTVLVDLSGTWLNEKSRSTNKQELEGIAAAIVTTVPSLKAPVSIRYFEIGDGSLSRAPLCEARYSPNIFHTADNSAEFADLGKLRDFFAEDCTRLILMRKPQTYTDISGALNTVARMSAVEIASYKAVLVLSDFREERRKSQTGGIGSLRGIHALLIYRVLDEDRYNPAALDARIDNWKSTLTKAGATVTALDDVILEPAQLKRLLAK